MEDEGQCRRGRKKRNTSYVKNKSGVLQKMILTGQKRNTGWANKDIYIYINFEWNLTKNYACNRCKLWFGLRKEKKTRAQQETRKRAKTEDGYSKKKRTGFNGGKKLKKKRIKIEYGWRKNTEGAQNKWVQRGKKNNNENISYSKDQEG